MSIFPKKKCFFCDQRIVPVYTNPLLLHRFQDYFNRIKRREHTGVCLRHQKRLAREIKHARHVALCGFVR